VDTMAFARQRDSGPAYSLTTFGALKLAVTAAQ